MVPEAETTALQAEMLHYEEWLSAIVCVTEVMRATHRWVRAAGARGRAAAGRVDRAQEVLRSVALIDVGSAAVWSAGEIEPRELRSLDAIHLATAIDLAADLDGFFTYDTRLATAARAAGLLVLSPH